MIEDETKLKVGNVRSLASTRSLLGILLEIDNDLSSLVMMNYIATITPTNLSNLESLYNINTFWEERSVLSQEDIIFNYHLQRLIKNLNQCETVMASLLG